jgi:fucose 4-O-acetylase-like acetyltransferase
MRGMAICIVVVAHATRWPIHSLYWCIPLFFFLPGYLFRQPDNVAAYIGLITRKLLGPYFVFMGVIAAPALYQIYLHQGTEAMVARVGVLLLGGERITGVWAAFWFPTCFLFTHVLYTLCMRWFSALTVSVLCIPMLGLATLNDYFADFWLPLGLNIVPFVFPLMHAGWLYRHRQFSPRMDHWFHLAVISIGLAYTFIVLVGFAPPLQVKIAKYGWPVITVTCAVFTVIGLKLAFDRLVHRRSVSLVFGNLGKASMIIMFVHQPIQLMILNVAGIYNEPVRIVLTLIGSYLFYRLFKALRWA